jgi:hypothetical protein
VGDVDAGGDAGNDGEVGLPKPRVEASPAAGSANPADKKSRREELDFKTHLFPESTVLILATAY